MSEWGLGIVGTNTLREGLELGLNKDVSNGDRMGRKEEDRWNRPLRCDGLNRDASKLT